jgi:SAM-dependent methyltransferase
MWEFFNEQPKAAAGRIRLGKVDELPLDSPQLVGLFVGALKGRHKIIDVGCGVGIPGLYVAPYVGEVVGVDPAPRMIEAARENARALGITNATFLQGSADHLPFAEGRFDGAALCGTLESMDWETIHSVMGELRRVLSAGARIAVSCYDRGEGQQGLYFRKTFVWDRDGRLMLSVDEATDRPHVTKRTRYVVDPQSPSAQTLRKGLSGDVPAATALGPEDLRPEDIQDAWYDEAVGFNGQMLSTLVESYGFRDTSIQDCSGTLFLTALK